MPLQDKEVQGGTLPKWVMTHRFRITALKSLQLNFLFVWFCFFGLACVCVCKVAFVYEINGFYLSKNLLLVFD